MTKDIDEVDSYLSPRVTQFGPLGYTTTINQPSSIKSNQTLVKQAMGSQNAGNSKLPESTIGPGNKVNHK
jgi:hypothetical protein